jgi:hypothetical protein
MMRKFLVSLAVAASALAVASPAAAQWTPQHYGYPQPPAYGYPQQPAYGYPQPGYGYGYGHGYGYQNPYQPPYGNAFAYQASYQQLRATQVRINRIQADLRRLAQYRMISRSEYSNRLQESREIERRFFRNTRDGWGLSIRELYDVQNRIARLEQRISRDIRDGRHWRFRW